MPSTGRFRYLDIPASEHARSRGTLLLLHGFPLNPTMWLPQFELAGRGWRLLVPELRGFGNGAGDPPTTSIDDYAADAIDLLDTLHVEDAVIGGLSMGGYVAFSIFRHAARYVRALILADTRAEGDAPDTVEGRKRMQRLAEEKGVSAIADQLLPKLVGETTRRTRPEIVEQIRAQIVANSVASITGALTALMTRPDSTPTLRSIHCPTLIVVGDEDAITPPPFSQAMHQAIAGSELVVIPGAGHMSNMEQPETFTAAVARFLDHRV